MIPERYLVVGLGKTGQSVARYLKRNDIAFDWFDTRPMHEEYAAIATAFPETPVYFETFPVDRLHQIKAMIMSPGVADDHFIFQCAMDYDIPIFGDVEWFSHQVKGPVLAITGTNGKSTVTTLVGELLKTAGIKVCVAGNIGLPVLDALTDETKDATWVLELSSFQLMLTEHLQTSASTILNITPDHLDRHHTFEAYIEAKQRVYKNSRVCFYNRLDVQTKPHFDGTVCSYGLNRPTRSCDWGIVDDPQFGLSIVQGEFMVCPVSALKIAGQHNILNAMAACALASTQNVSFDTMQKVLSDFTGLSHRCEWVRTLEGVQWIDDSKGTNIGATLSAIEGIGKTMQGKIVLIAGGQGKGADFSFLKEVVSRYVSHMVLIGQDAPLLKQALFDCVSLSEACSLKDAVYQAKKHAQAGDIVLLSPACASLDMFKDFNDRGDQFKAIVRSL